MAAAARVAAILFICELQFQRYGRRVKFHGGQSDEHQGCRPYSEAIDGGDEERTSVGFDEMTRETIGSTQLRFVLTRREIPLPGRSTQFHPLLRDNAQRIPTRRRRRRKRDDERRRRKRGRPWPRFPRLRAKHTY